MSQSRTRGIIGVSLTSILLALLLLPDLSLAQPVGGTGESCRARSDCEEGLRCIDNICVEPEGDDEEEVPASTEDDQGEPPSSTEEQPPTSTEDPGASNEDGGADDGGARWTDFELGGTHFFAGLTFAPGMTGKWDGWGNIPIESAFFFAIRLGVLFNYFELAAEIAPVTWVWDFAPDRSSVTFNVSVGGLIRLADHAFWPMRFGLGLAARDLSYADVYMQGKLDLIGFAYQYGHLIFELNLPSVRFHSEFQQEGIWAFLFNISITYVL